MTLIDNGAPNGRRGRRFGLIVCLLVVLVAAGSGRTSSAPAQDASAQVARGEYLATHVALCVQCHSPRDARGILIETETFRGGAIPFRSPYAGEDWAFNAPSLRGLVGLTDAQAVALLTTGAAPGRPAPKRPMPPFRLSQADAEAIVAFLRAR